MRVRFAVLFLGLIVPLVPIAPASATTTPEGRALELVNAERVEQGKRKLVRTVALDALAERQAKRMRAAGELFHSDLGATVEGSWRRVGENVGYAGTVAALHRALMRSPPHRENILRSSWDQVGIGIVRNASGTVYEAQIFVDR